MTARASRQVAGVGRAGGVLAAFLVAGVLSAVTVPGADAQVVPQPRTGENYRLGTDARAARGRDAPALAVNPANPDHIVAVDEDLYNGFCDFHSSLDGGRTWTSGHLMAPDGFEPQACSRFDGGDYLHLDSSVEWGSGQNVYTTFSWNRPGETDSVLVARSSDGGRTFATAVVAIPGIIPPSDFRVEGYVRPEMAVQVRPGLADRLYVTSWFLHLVAVTAGTGPDRRAAVTRSDDGGLTWTAPVQAQRAGERARELSEPVVGPDGTVYTAWRTQDVGAGAPNFIVVARSFDQGQTWSAVNARQITGTAGSIPSLEVSPTTGTVFVAYEDPPGGDRDIRIQRSTDRGATWSTPARVNDDAVGNGVEQRIPDVSVAPNGRVDVTWHDRRHTYRGPATPAAPAMGDQYWAWSADDGLSFSPNRRVTDRTYNLQIGLNGPVGSYTWYAGVSAPLGNDGLLFAWPDSREGSFDSGAQDTYLARTALNGPATPPVKRLPAADNVALSAALSQLSYPGGGEQLGAVAVSRVVVVNEDDATAALLGAVLARANWAPLLASPAAGLPAALRNEAERMHAVGAYVIGDESALSPLVVRDLAAAGIPEDKIVRLAGADPADTARLVADAIDARTPAAKAARTPAVDAVVAVNPASPDAPAAAGLAASLRLPVLHVGRDSVPAATAAAIDALAVTRTLVVGGPDAVGAGVLAQLPSATRLGAGGVYDASAAAVAESRTRGLPTNVIYTADGARPMDAALLGAAVARLGGVLVLAPPTDTGVAEAVERLGLRTLADRVVAVNGTGRRGGVGYWAAAADGGIFSFGAANFLGSTGSMRLNRPVVGMAPTPTGNGYWLAASDGGVFAFGDARFFGSTGGLRLTRPVVGMAATTTGKGYWLVASDGGVFAFGDAAFHGSTGSRSLTRPVVGMTATPTGEGYWLVASDGGIFAFGDARFAGSTGAMTLAKPIAGMAATPTGDGYWLVGADGGIFAFGRAGFAGSTGAMTLNRAVVGVAATPTGQGYWLVASDGGIFAFGDAAFLGSAGGLRLKDPVVGLAGRRPG